MKLFYIIVASIVGAVALFFLIFIIKIQYIGEWQSRVEWKFPYVYMGDYCRWRGGALVSIQEGEADRKVICKIP